jgi:hypothetical protein
LGAAAKADDEITSIAMANTTSTFTQFFMYIPPFKIDFMPFWRYPFSLPMNPSKEILKDASRS